MWMTLCVLIMIIRPFVTRPTLFNSSAGAFMAAPLISEDMQWVGLAIYQTNEYVYHCDRMVKISLKSTKGSVHFLQANPSAHRLSVGSINFSVPQYLECSDDEVSLGRRRISRSPSLELNFS